MPATEAMSQLLRPAIIIALYALLLPVVGPMLDHHYVEWQHNHGHAYLSGVKGAPGYHLHVYDSTGSHGHVAWQDSAGKPDLPEGLVEGLAYFTSYDGSGTGLIYSPTGPSTQSLCFPDHGDCPLLASYTVVEVSPDGAFAAPPRKPPAA